MSGVTRLPIWSVCQEVIRACLCVSYSVVQAAKLGGSPQWVTSDGPRFALGGGVAFTPLDANKFVRITGFQRPRTGEATDMLTSVVGVGENSTSWITPLAMLHANLWTSRHVGLAASLGVTAKAGIEGTDVEYLLGPSISFLDNRVFITVGGYAGKQHKLAGDLFVGAALPQDLNEIPTTKNTKWSIGFGLTWKIR